MNPESKHYRIIYSFVIYLYKLAAVLAAAAGHRKAKTFLELRRAAPQWTEGRYLWIHAASAGEANQAVPLAGELKRIFGARIMLTVFSPSGFRFHKDNPAFDAVINLPLDSRANARDFVSRLNPVLAVFVRNELWHNYIDELKRAAIPVFLVNTPGHVLYPKGIFMRQYITSCLRRMTAVFAASEPGNVPGGVVLARTIGNTKWEGALGAESQPDTALFREFLGGSVGVIGGSTWPEDEAVLGSWHKRKADEGVKLIIAPHDADARRISELRSRFPDACLFSEFDGSDPAEFRSGKIMILDVYGRLRSAYAAGHIAFIGGGFGEGVHNITEAAVHGLPTVFGPKHEKFEEAAELIRASAAFSVRGQDEFDHIMDSLAASSGQRSAIRAELAGITTRHRGISRNIAEEIAAMILPRT